MSEPEPTPEEVLRIDREERDARIAELESKAAKGRPVGIRAPVALLCIVGALFLAWLNRHDVAYFFSPREPITLGGEGDYQLDAIVTNRYVQLRGVPTRRAYYENQEAMVLVGLIASPFVVRRPRLTGEESGPNGKPPPPNQQPFAVRGRLLSRGQAPAWDRAFHDFKEWGELQPRDGELYLVVEGDKPGRDVGLGVVLGLLAGFIALNAYFLVRDVRYRLANRKPAIPR
jgi:hypothetical protein